MVSEPVLDEAVLFPALRFIGAGAPHPHLAEHSRWLPSLSHHSSPGRSTPWRIGKGWGSTPKGIAKGDQEMKLRKEDPPGKLGRWLTQPEPEKVDLGSLCMFAKAVFVREGRKVFKGRWSECYCQASRLRSAVEAGVFPDST